MAKNNQLFPRRAVIQLTTAGAAVLASAPFTVALAQGDVSAGMAVDAITIMAQLRARPGQEKALREALIEVATASRKEEGCIAFDMHVSREEPAVFLAFERWSDDAAIKAHFETPHFKAIVARSEELLAEPMEAHFARQIV